MIFKEEWERRRAEAEEIFGQYLPKETGTQKRILEAVNYAALAGGKRLRPVFMMAAYEMFHEKDDRIAPFMAAIEMIHTYSLVHDDLPAMDDDDYRRGRKTTHLVFGEAFGVLAGDALLNLAYETTAEAFQSARTLEDYKKTGEALRILSKKAGVYGMVGGQSVDVECEGKTPDFPTLQFIYHLKTGALIEAALMVGAIMGGADKEEIDRMEQIASRVGLAFQIQDDILDVVSTTQELGKPVGSDEKNEKMTYVSYAGLEEAKQKQEELSREAQSMLEQMKMGEEKKGSRLEAKEFLKQLILQLIHRTH